MNEKDSRKIGDALTETITQLNTIQVRLVEIQMELDRLHREQTALEKPKLPPTS